MDEKKINESLNRAVEQMVPDLCEKLLEQPVEKLKQPDFYTRQRNHRKIIMRTMTALAASLVLCVLSIHILLGDSRKTCVVVAIDVNPGIELSLDENYVVISAKPANPDGANFLKNIQLEQLSIERAFDILVEELSRESYLEREKDNFLLMSVQEKKTVQQETADGMMEQLLESIKRAGIRCEVLAQSYSPDLQIKKIARKYGISPGKAALVERIFTRFSGQYTREELAGKTIEELILLAKEAKLPEQEDAVIMNDCKETEAEESSENTESALSGTDTEAVEKESEKQDTTETEDAKRGDANDDDTDDDDADDRDADDRDADDDADDRDADDEEDDRDTDDEEDDDTDGDDRDNKDAGGDDADDKDVSDDDMDDGGGGDDESGIAAKNDEEDGNAEDAEDTKDNAEGQEDEKDDDGDDSAENNTKDDVEEQKDDVEEQEDDRDNGDDQEEEKDNTDEEDEETEEKESEDSGDDEDSDENNEEDD